ncbi:MAG: hypothetical protein AAFO01_06185 [Pseudomonadota bacterium]
MRRLFAAALILALSSTLPAAQTLGDADALPSDSANGAQLPFGLFVSPAVSTLGLGLEAGARLNDNFGLRFGGNWLGFEYDGVEGDLDYDADVTLASLGALVDYHPFSGGFRVSGGLRFNFNQADLMARQPTISKLVMRSSHQTKLAPSRAMRPLIPSRPISVSAMGRRCSKGHCPSALTLV